MDTFAAEFLAEWMPKLKSTFEPSKTGLFTNRTDDFSSACSVVRTILDAVGTAIRNHKGYIYIPDLSEK